MKKSRKQDNERDRLADQFRAEREEVERQRAKARADYELRHSGEGLRIITIRRPIEL